MGCASSTISKALNASITPATFVPLRFRQTVNAPPSPAGEGVDQLVGGCKIAGSHIGQPTLSFPNHQPIPKLHRDHARVVFVVDQGLGWLDDGGARIQEWNILAERGEGSRDSDHQGKRLPHRSVKKIE